MEINKFSTIVFFITITISILNLATITHSTFSPTDSYLLNCGSPTTTTLISTQTFYGDTLKPYSNLLTSPPSSTSTLTDQNPSPNSPSLYHTARIFTKPSSYKFKTLKKGTHIIRLHFSPFISINFNLFNTLFNVSTNGYLLLSNFNTKNPILKEFIIWIENDVIEILFTPSKESGFGFAFVNAIEVFSAPDELIADTGKLVNANGNETFKGIMHHGLETVYRLNVGGVKVTPFNDTLWRTWIPDDEFFKYGNNLSFRFSGRIKYQEGGLSREVAPDNVFSSARVLSENSSDLTWVLPVNVGYRYLVRTHFCDIASRVLYELYFNVYINGYLVSEDLDLSSLTGMLASPYYADFVLDVGNLDVVTISIYPSKQSSSGRIKGLLNGLEVMKMTNSQRGLDGKVSAVSLVKSSRTSNNTGGLVPTVAVISLMIAAFAVMYKKRVMRQDYVAWSRLPLDASRDSLKV